MQKRIRKFAKPVVESYKKERKLFHPVMKRLKIFTDMYPHKCPGNKRVFKPEVVSRTIVRDLGKTESIIEGETSQEIPLYWLKRVSPGNLEVKLELVTFSDIRERERALLPYEERIAHTHFPKEFVTVQVVGPAIPASLIITKIPSKRECEFESHVPEQLEIKKTKGKTENEMRDMVQKEAELDSSSRILPVDEEEKEEMVSMEAIIFEENEQSEESLSEMEKTISDEGKYEKETNVIFSKEKEQVERTFESEKSATENRKVSEESD